MILIYDRAYPFSGYFGAHSVCHIRVYRPEQKGALPVAIAAEYPDNPGTSITNATERLATQVWNELLPDAREGLIWIEHYPARLDHRGRPSRDRLAQETFDLVDFELAENDGGPDYAYLLPEQRRKGYVVRHPTWWRKPRKWVEVLIGQPYPPLPPFSAIEAS